MLFSAPDNREEESTRRRMSDSTLREPRNAYYVQRYARDDEDDRRAGEGSRSACSCSLDFALDGYLVESCVWLLSYFADHEPVCDTRLTVLSILFLYLTVTSQYRRRG